MKIAFDFDETLVNYSDDFKEWSVNKLVLKLLLAILEQRKKVYIVTARCPALSRKNIHNRAYVCKTRHRSGSKAFIGLVKFLDLPTVETFVLDRIPEDLVKYVEVVYTDGDLKGQTLADLGINILIDDSEEQREDAQKHGVSSIHPADVSNLKQRLKEIGFIK
jgi:hypothetical protein